MRVTFRERMAGALRLTGEQQPREMELRLDVDWRGEHAPVRGTVQVAGWPEQPCRGTMRIAPIRARRIRYQLDFGQDLHLDGWKSVSLWHPVRSMTRLPATLTRSGEILGVAALRFHLRQDLMRFLLSFRRARWTS